MAITPCLILVLVAGRNGLSGALNASQVLLSLLLPFVSAPLIYFTSNKKIMRVQINPNTNNCRDRNIQTSSVGTSSNKYNNSYIPLKQDSDNAEYLEMYELNKSHQIEPSNDSNDDSVICKDMSNGIVTTILSILVWIIVSALNFYMLVSFSSGQDVHF